MTKKVWRQIALVLTLIAVVSMTAYAQPGGRGGQRGGQRGGFGSGGFGGGGFGGFGGGNAAQFALRSDVSKELDLDDDQKDELQDVSRNAPGMREIMQDLDIDFRAMRDMSSEERGKLMANVQKQMAKAGQETTEEVLDVLTSKQKTRYRQLKFQYEISRTQVNAMNALSVTDVDLDDVDRDELREAMEKASDKLKELRLKTYAAALGEVVGESKVEKLLADLFEFDARAGFSAFGRGGGGQRGGGGGRAGGGRPQRPGGDDGGDNPRRRRRPSSDDDNEEEDDNPRRRRRE